MRRPVTPLDVVCHVPEIKADNIVGCLTCSWRISPTGPGTYWFQFVEHVFSTCCDGSLVLNEDDVQMLGKMDRAFRGPAVTEDI